jgi:hypothetical protein
VKWRCRVSSHLGTPPQLCCDVIPLPTATACSSMRECNSNVAGRQCCWAGSGTIMMRVCCCWAGCTIVLLVMRVALASYSALRCSSLLYSASPIKRERDAPCRCSNARMFAWAIKWTTTTIDRDGRVTIATTLPLVHTRAAEGLLLRFAACYHHAAAAAVTWLLL